MCNATISIDDAKFDAFNKLAKENGMEFADWAVSLMENALEDHELAKTADEAYEEYLKNPMTYSAEEVEENLW